MNYFCSIWEHNKPLMDVASQKTNIPVKYKEHPDHDFVAVETEGNENIVFSEYLKLKRDAEAYVVIHSCGIEEAVKAIIS